MPDPPSSELQEEGEPTTKRQKIGPDIADEEWEAVEREEGTAINGLPEVPADEPVTEPAKESAEEPKTK